MSMLQTSLPRAVPPDPDRVRRVLTALALPPAAFEGMVAVVTGGARGIGRALADLLAHLGARVVTVDRADPGPDVAGFFPSLTTPTQHRRVDLTEPRAFEHTLADVTRTEGPIDLFVHAAADFQVRGLLDTTDDLWDSTMAVGAGAFVRGARVVVPSMCARGRGVLVSLLAPDGIPHLAASSAAKAALRSATRSLAAELADWPGVHAFSVMPGLVDTTFIRTEFSDYLEHVGLDLPTFLRRASPNLGYPGLLPVFDCAAAMAKALHEPGQHAGTILDPAVTLARLGLAPLSLGEDTREALDAAGVDRLLSEIRRQRKHNRNLDAAVQAKRNEAFRLAAIVESSGDAIITATTDGRIATWNKAAEHLFGYTEAEVVGESVVMLVPESEREKHTQLLRSRWTEITGATTVEARRVHRDGTLIPVSIRLSPVRDEHGQQVGISAIVRDIRPRLEAEQAVARARARARSVDKMVAVGRLAGGVAHDLNNMLMAVQGGVTVALETLPAGSAAATALADVLAATRRTRSLSRQLVTVSTHRPTRLQDVDLSEALAHVVPRLQARLAPGHRIELHAGGPQDVVRIDQSQLEEVLNHLVDNASQAMGPTGCIRLSLHASTGSDELPDASGVVLQVADTGAGMSREVQERAFEPFFTTRPFGSGAGMGLSLVYGSMQALGGDARITSAPGEGTTVSLFFPRAAADRPERPSSRRRALVYVRHPLMRRAVGRMLERIGLSVVAFAARHKLEEALASAHTAHLLVTDRHWAAGASSATVLESLTLHRVPWICLSDAYAPRSGGPVPELAVPLALPFTMDDLQRAVRKATASLADEPPTAGLPAGRHERVEEVLVGGPQ